MRREAGGGWDQSAASTRLWPLREAELIPALDRAGFENIETSGSMQAEPFDVNNSPDLIVAAKKNSRLR
jgi:hypothetical protein